MMMMMLTCLICWLWLYKYGNMSLYQTRKFNQDLFFEHNRYQVCIYGLNISEKYRIFSNNVEVFSTNREDLSINFIFSISTSGYWIANKILKQIKYVMLLSFLTLCLTNYLVHWKQWSFWWYATKNRESQQSFYVQHLSECLPLTVRERQTTVFISTLHWTYEK